MVFRLVNGFNQSVNVLLMRGKIGTGKWFGWLNTITTSKWCCCSADPFCSYFKSVWALVIKTKWKCAPKLTVRAKLNNLVAILDQRISNGPSKLIHFTENSIWKSDLNFCLLFAQLKLACFYKQHKTDATRSFTQQNLIFFFQILNWKLLSLK